MPKLLNSRLREALPVAQPVQPGANAAAPAAADAPRFGEWGVETRHIAAQIRPGDDFYRHVNQGWLATAQIPPGLPMSSAFVALALQTEEQVQALIDELKAQPAPPGSPAQQIAAVHASFMDMERRNALGSRMLAAGVAKTLQLGTHRDFARLMGSIGFSSVIRVGVEPDPADPQRYIVALGQSGLGLPGRDYYLQQEEPYIGLRSAYRDYIEGVFARAGVADGQRRAAAVLAFETELAATQWTPAEQRDALKTHHPMSLEALARYAPGFDWAAFLAGSGFSDVQRVNVLNDSAIRAAAALFGRTPLETLRAYSVYHHLDNRAPLLSQPWVDAHFDFFRRRLAGIAEPRPLARQALDFLAQPLLAEPLGKLYAERYFPAESKAAIDKLVGFLRQALRERLAHSEWMDAATREAAVAKLDALGVKIGYPEKWHDFSSVRVSPDDLLGNLVRYEEWRRQDARAMLQGPVRKWEWSARTMPQVVNACYSPAGNEIVFPAALLQPPFFDPQADPAVNYGAIGMVIGHEIGHGFDDQGKHYDGQGRLRNWWSEAASRNFAARTRVLVDQYAQFSPLPGLPLNGQLTLGENIGDLGGLAIAWCAYRKLLASEHGGEAPLLDGYSGNQRFFLGYAQLWRWLFTDGFLRRITLTDPHSPGEFRVNGVLRNFTPWYEAFAVTPADALYLPPAARVTIW